MFLEFVYRRFGKWIRFRNVVSIRNIRRWTKSKNMIPPSVIHHGQNPLELVYCMLMSELHKTFGLQQDDTHAIYKYKRLTPTVHLSNYSELSNHT
jgi:hypothetical protein